MRTLPMGMLFALMAAQGAAMVKRVRDARMKASTYQGEYMPSRAGRRFVAKRDGTWRGRWIGSMKVSHIGRR